ncbi:MAG: type II toxin-antitoxin system MqsA family antitoxin [Polyangiaceae bacterium]|nr:type II toxin-antitoxin system MqsA family antitoxin [Polyangiaceae bacterium]
MICSTCGGDLEERVTDLPFKLDDRTIVIVKNVPVLQCPMCNAYLLPDAVMAVVERLLDSANRDVELAVMRYAA